MSYIQFLIISERRHRPYIRELSRTKKEVINIPNILYFLGTTDSN